MMRAARFAAQLEFDVDGGTLAALVLMTERIEIVSAERVRDELSKLLCGAAPRRGLEVLVDTGLADHVLPELPALKLEIDEHHRHKDVYEHSLTVLDQAIAQETGPDGAVPAPDLVLRLAALLHDVGKPPTRRFEAGGGVSFHHHEVVGAKMVAKRLKALRYDKQVVKDVARLVELHLRFHGYGDGAWTDSAVRRYVTDAGPLLERLHRLTRADCTTRNRRKAQRLRESYDDLERRIAELQAKEEEPTPSGPTSTGSRSWRSSGSAPDRWWARRTSTSWSCASTAGRSTRRRRAPTSCGGGPSSRSRRRPERGPPACARASARGREGAETAKGRRSRAESGTPSCPRARRRAGRLRRRRWPGRPRPSRPRCGRPRPGRPASRPGPGRGRAPAARCGAGGTTGRRRRA